jgi:succinate dehydrogenase / fumarate reductase, cytochrome b subunit
MERAITIYNSTIGKKAIMAVTGILGVLYVIGHMIGNLQAFPMLGGREGINSYAVFLRHTHGLLWVARLVLLVAVILHIVVAYQLARMSQTSRPIDYKFWKPAGASTYASRTMRWSGPILGLFILYHLLDMTFGTVHPGFQELHPYENLISGFSHPLVAGVYIIAMIALGFHMYHGAWSMFSSLGLNHWKYNRAIRYFAIVSTIVVVAGFIAVPIGVLTGIIH